VTWTVALELARAQGVRIHRLPSWAPMGGWTFLHVWLRHESGVTLAHELVHVAQQRRDRSLFFLRYVFSARWRVRYEVEAYQVDRAHGRSAQAIARALSGPLYLWACSFDEAVELLAAAAPLPAR
jgi:hypothetical protein